MTRLTGLASRTERSYPVGSFDETIARGAFAGVENADVVLLAEHQGMPLAATRNGSLRLKETDEGLSVDADLPDDDPLCQAVTSRIRSGIYKYMSFSFQARRQQWSDDHTKRRILEASLDQGDVSVVAHPASKHTAISARSGLTLEQRRAEAEAVGSHVVTYVEGLYLAEGRLTVPGEERKKSPSKKHLMQWAKEGIAMPDGSYYVRDHADLVNGLRDWNRTGQDPSVLAHLRKRAKELGLSSVVEDWVKGGKRSTVLDIYDWRQNAERERRNREAEALALRGLSIDDKAAIGAAQATVDASEKPKRLCVLCRGTGRTGKGGKRTMCRNCKGSGVTPDRSGDAVAQAGGTAGSGSEGGATPAVPNASSPPANRARARY
jgi:HK97 family phage prohead protease